MSAAGVVLIDLVALVFVAWILSSVRRGRLYVGYGVLSVLAIVPAAVVVSVSSLRHAADRWLGLLFGTEAPLVVALAGIALVLVYVLTQLSILSNRLATLVQDLAIQQVDRAGDVEPPGQRRSP